MSPETPGKSKTKPKVKIRQATEADIEPLAALNRAAYPTLAEDDIVWGRSHLRSHQRLFPAGQLVAEVNGKLVGACCSLVVNLGSEPLRHHTWAGITDSGYFTTHDLNGDTLYGGDVFVHPDTRGMGVGHALYEARRKLCKKMNLRRILSGGRLWNYMDHADKYSPEEYAQRVAHGEIRDLVLSFQLREGFELRGVMPHYLQDKHSKNYASLIEWLNPDYQPPTDAVRKVRVGCIQYQMRKIKSFQEFASQVEYFVDIGADYGCDFLLFPELFSLQLLSSLDALSSIEGIRKLAGLAGKFKKLMSSMATRFGVYIIAGSHPVKKGSQIQNICYICLPDGQVIEQPKIHVTPNERRWWGISGGHDVMVVDTPQAKIGVLICYDSEFPEAARHLADSGVEILFVPFCTDNRQGYLRVRYCCHARAIENQIYVALAGNVGNLPAVSNMDINYGQAAVLTPCDFAFARDGIAAEADSNEETILVCDLDLDDLIEARNSGTVTPRLDRRHDLFRVVTTFPGQTPSAEDDRPLGNRRHPDPE